jgi:hypothetical protein
MARHFDSPSVRELLDDRRSGASEIERAVRSALTAAAAEAGAAAEAALREATDVVVTRFPVMAALLRLLDEAWTAWLIEGSAGLARAVAARDDSTRWTAVTRSLAELGVGRRRILTLSRSGTVLGALAALARKGADRVGGGADRQGADALPEVLVGEGRPEEEGVTMAGALGGLGYRATVVVDAALPALAAGAPAPATLGWAAQDTLVLLGCDAVGPGGFVNKVGSYGLARAAVGAGVPVLVIADSRKLLPFDPPLPCERELRAGEEVERLRFDFERVPLEALTRCLVEDSALDPPALQARIASLPASDGELWNRLQRARRGDATRPI